MNKVIVIGISNCVTERIEKIIEGADAVVATQRFTRQFGYLWKGTGKKIVPIAPVEEALRYLKDNMDKERIVVLASGDPLFYGIGRRLIEEFDKERLEFLPSPSYMQIAFAKVKEPWDDAVFLSLHGRDVKDIAALIALHRKVCLFTDAKNSPSYLAGLLIAEGISHFRAHVCENMDTEGERIISGTLNDIAGMSFSPLNVMILIADSQPPVLNRIFGIEESGFSHSKGLITKDEVRAVTLHKLSVPEKGVIWDVGSGSGSVSIEAARLNREIVVYAIERDPEQIIHINKNRTKFGVFNIRVIQGEAPDMLYGLPDPDRVFIGGSGGRLKEIVDYGVMKLKPAGTILINAITLKTLTDGVAYLEENGLLTDVTEVAINKCSGQGSILKAQNAIFVIRGKKC
ncbi:MAG: precorrin-6y C5,15-methyltransferase (decarboxylating) subunit CbiE [Nitrospirae bacterium]|nr:precorrin-6y C5,15-methyltransferase (decarboxylating) subunit CbiE [Nitrospirota bacterium]